MKVLQSTILILAPTLTCLLAIASAAEAGKAQAKDKADAKSQPALVTVSTSELKPRPVRRIEFIALPGCGAEARQSEGSHAKEKESAEVSDSNGSPQGNETGERKHNKAGAERCEDKAKQIASTLKDFVDGVQVKAVGEGLLVSVANDVPEKLDRFLFDTVEKLTTKVKPQEPTEKKERQGNDYSGYVDLRFIKASDAVKRLENWKYGKLGKFETHSDNRILVNWQVPSDEEEAKKVKESFRLFRQAVEQLDQPHSSKLEAENPAMRLYHLDATTVASALNQSVADLKVKAVGGNQIVISGAKPLEEQDVEELKRRIALLDLPQPKVALQVWGFQMSHEDPKQIDKWLGEVKEISDDLNEKIQDAFYAGWGHVGWMVENQLRSDAQSKAHNKAIAECVGGGAKLADCLNRNRDQTNPKAAPLLGTPLYRYVTTRFGEGKGQQQRYGLGYGLYANAQPSLGKMLLVLAAAQEPANHAAKVIQRMRDNAPTLCNPPPQSDASKNDSVPFKDFGDTLGSTLKGGRLRLLQAAIADFFFHYKWSVQYPHDFSPYLFSRSADEMENVMSPLIDAFNRDVEACVQNALDHHSRKLPKGRKRNFLAAVLLNKKIRSGLAQSGMMRVATLSGSQAKADGTSISYFDVTAPRPTLSELVQNKDAQVNALTAHLEGNPVQALGLLASLAIPEQTVVQVQRGMGIQLTPRALPTGSGAEIDVAIGVGEGDAAPTQIGENSNPHMLDRVANHSVTTKVRVEALKLFEVSTFSNAVHHPQPDGIVPVVGHAWNAVFGAVPGAGRLFKWRRRPAPMHHRSTALISAIVVPTPMDLAVGVRFGYDLERNPWGQKVRRWTTPDGALRFHTRFHECLIKPEDVRIEEGSDCGKIPLRPVDNQDQKESQVASSAPSQPNQALEVRVTGLASQ